MTIAFGYASPEIIINQTGTSTQDQVELSVLSNGNIVAVWRSAASGDSDIYARIFSPDGTSITNEFLVNQTTPGQQALPSVVGLSNGNVAFFWNDSNSTQVTGRVFNGTSPITGEVTFGFANMIALPPAAAQFGNGNILVVHGSDYHIFDSSLNVVHGPVDYSSGSNTQNPAVAILQNGNAAIVYSDSTGVAVTIVNSSSNILVDSSYFQFGSDYGPPKVAALSNGNFVVAWSRNDGGTFRSEAQIFEADGDAITGPFDLDNDDEGNQFFNDIVALNSGGFAVSWHVPELSFELDLRVRAFDAGGAALTEPISVQVDTDGNQSQSSLVALDGSGFALAWRNDDLASGDGDGWSVMLQSYYAFDVKDYTLVEGNSVASSVLELFESPGGAPLKVVEINGDNSAVGTAIEGALGTLTVHADGSFTYIADQQFALDLGSDTSGIEAFTIRLDNGAGSVELQLKFEVLGLDNYILGTSGVDTLTGTSGRDIIMADAGNDTINGNGAYTSYNGGDILYGGTGNDTYNLKNNNDHVVEFEGEGTDKVQIAADYTLTPDVEELVLLGTGNFNGTGNESTNKITGNSGNNILDGGAGNDTLIGGAGNDTYYVDNAGDVLTEALGQGNDTVWSSLAAYTLAANVENLFISFGGKDGKGNGLNNFLLGNTDANKLEGDAGDDTFEGGLGLDTLIGGAGHDTYYINDGDVVDIIQEASGGGTDTVFSSQSNYTLAANVEKLFLFGSAKNATGNALANTIVGGLDNDTIDGLGGADEMKGGAGNDVYYVDTSGDLVVELDGEGSSDQILSGVSYTLPIHVENLSLQGSANINATGNSVNNTLYGNSGNNILNGAGGADYMTGGQGNDTYVVDHIGDVVVEDFLANGTDLVQSSVTWNLGKDVENLTLTGTAHISGFGNALDNIITGNSGNNTLNGGAGKDTLIGGLGNDTYYIDLTNEVITENANAGTDTVFASVSGYTLANNVENLTLIGTVAAGTGNSGNNLIVGNSAANTLTGAGGNDTLDGGAGFDTLIGGLGNDIYYVDNNLDDVQEAAGQGTDVVYSKASDYILATNVENVFAAGTGSIAIRGNTGNNVLVGNAGDNLLVGNQGGDTLTGGAGADTFQFTAPDFGKDKITDFSVTSGDQLSFNQSVFLNFNDVMDSASQGLNGTVIAYNANNAILLMGVKLSTLSADDFTFY